MANVICLECKSEVAADSESCPECGFPFDSVSPTKCPECGSLVVFSGGSCPECGFPVEALDELLKEAQAPLANGLAPAPTTAQLERLAAESTVTSDMLKEQLSSLNEVVVNLGSYLDDARSSKSTILNDLYSGIGKFLDDAEKIKEGMAEAVTEQHAKATDAMQQTVSSFTEEMKAVIEGVNSARDCAVGAVHSAAEQAKGDLETVGLQIQAKIGSTVDYIFYIALAMVFFVALNIAVSAYVVRLVKQNEPADGAAVKMEEKQIKSGHH